MTRTRPRGFFPGSVLAGRYQIVAVLGVGAMGAVYAVHDRELDQHVALKVLTRTVDTRPDVLERFRREVRMARRVTHANAARVFDIGDDEGVYFLTMELIEGESLAALLHREGALSLERVVDIGRQICDGLGAVHQAGVVHRDLKPANILVETSGRVVLTDFGIARPISHDERLTLDERMMVGTPMYMAPEQVSGTEVTTQTDLYALGLVLYEMATGERPFHGETAPAVAAARLHGDPLPPRQFRSMPDWLERVIMACLRREPSQRPADAMSVRALLSSRAVDLEPTKLEPQPGETHVAPAKAAEPAITGPLNDGLPSTELGARSLAVLPLRYRGPAVDSYLADALTEHLLDLLSMTHGLRVLAMGATQRFADDRDPRRVGKALGVDVLVDGAVHLAGTRLRVSIRLLDGQTGLQTWSDHVDGELHDVFELQDRIATRVVESLRLRLESLGYETNASTEAIEHYLRARVSMRSFTLGGSGPDGAAPLLERCLELAPEFSPALATYAIVCSRMWFFQGSPTPERDWVARGHEAMARALALAPGLPDAHLGAARMYTEGGRYSEGVAALVRAVELAPTHSAARAFLGTLLCEGGRPHDGIRHIELAVELDPTRVSPLVTVARARALHGERDRFEALAQRLWEEDPAIRFSVLVLRCRVALWDRDFEAVRRWRDLLVAGGLARTRFTEAAAGFALGEIELGELERIRNEVAPATSSPRFRAMIQQITVETLLCAGRTQDALDRLEESADGILIDVDWLEHCPLLSPLAHEPRMLAVHRKVRARAHAIWSVRYEH